MEGCSYSQEPLQMILKKEETVELIEKVTTDLSSGSYDSIKPSILSLSFNLKRHGPSLELLHGEHLKRLQQAMRSACRDTKLDLVSRVHLLEIIEMRSLNWAANHHVTNFYKMKLDEIKELSLKQSAPLSAQTNCPKPSSRLNANAPDFCLSMSFSNQPTKPVSFNPDCSPFVSLHQPPFNQNQLVSNSGDNLVSNPVNVPTSVEQRINGGTYDISSKDGVTIPGYYASLDNITGQDDNSIKDAINISEDTFTVQGDISNITIEEDYSSREAFFLQCDNVGKETTDVQGYYSSKNNNDGDIIIKEASTIPGYYASLDNITVQDDNIIKEASTVQSDNDIKTSVTVDTKDGAITLTSMNMDLLHTAQRLLQEGLKDKIFVKTTSHDLANPELIYQNPEMLELVACFQTAAN